MRVAFATTDGRLIDEHFGRAGMFAVYDIGKDGFEFFETRRFADGRDKAIEESKGLGQAHEELLEGKTEKLSDCKLIYFTEIGGPSAARLVRMGIMPMKVKGTPTIEESLIVLQGVIKNSPPPWMRKHLEDAQKQEVKNIKQEESL